MALSVKQILNLSKIRIIIKDDNYNMNSDNYKLRSSIRRAPNEAE